MDFRRQMNDFFAQIYRQNELYDIWAKQNRMKPSTVAVLYLLDQFETCTQGWISKIYLLPKQTIHTVVQELEQAGYLEKVSVSGRKEKPLRLTESGKRYTADKLGGLYRAEERAAAAMGAEPPSWTACFVRGLPAQPRFPQSICRIRLTACRWLRASCSARAAALLSPADRERDAQTRRAATSPC